MNGVGRGAPGRFRSLPEALYLLGTAAAGLWAGGRWLDPFGDPGFSWSLVYRAGSGEKLYRDIFVGYTPLSIDVLAPIERAAGFSALSWLLVNWIPAIVAGLLLLLAARRHLGTLERLAVAALLLGLSVFAAGSGRLVYPYYPGVVHALALGLGAVMLIPREGRWTLAGGIGAGALAALAFACKQEVGVAALAGLGASLVLDARRSWRPALAIAGGAGLVCAPLALRILAASPVDVLRDFDALWPLRIATPGDLSVLFRNAAGIQQAHWAVGIRSSLWWLLWYVALVFAAVMLGRKIRAPRAWAPLASLFLALGVWWAVEGRALGGVPRFASLSTLAALSVAAIALCRPRIPERAFLLGFGVFAGLTGVRCAFSPFTGGTYDGPGRFAACLAWVLLLCLLLPDLLVPEPQARRWASRLLALGILVVVAPTLAEGVGSLRSDAKVAVETPRGTVFASPPNARFLGILGKTVRASDRVFLIPESNGVDVLFGARNVSPLVDVLPGWLSPRVEADILARLERQEPDEIVVFRRPMPEFGAVELGRTYAPSLVAWWSERYVVVARDESGEVLRRAGAAGSNR